MNTKSRFITIIILTLVVLGAAAFYVVLSTLRL